jgi:hypothetical protein
VADALEREVDAVGADLLDGGDGVEALGRGIEEVGGPELAGQRLLGRVGVDGDDRQRVGQRERLDDVEADAADADDHRALAVADLGPVEHRAHPGDDAAAEQRRHLEGHIVGDLDRLAGLDLRDLGEHAEVGELEGLAPVEQERSRQPAHRGAAVRRLAGIAGRARPAVAERREDHVIADRHARDGGARFDDDAGSLMTQHDRCGERDRPVDHAHVAVAHTGGLDADAHLVGTQLPELEAGDDLQLPVLVDDALHRWRAPLDP